MSATDYTVGLICSTGAPPSKGGRSQNEDNYLLCRSGEIRFRDGNTEKVLHRSGHGMLAAVADGMGGHRFGDLAAAAAVQALSRMFYRERPSDPESALHSFFLQGHRKLRARAIQGQMGDIGTTLAAVWLIDHHAYWAHVGDSRIYHLRGETFTRLTRDHTRGEFATRDGRAPPSHAGSLAQSFIFGSRGMGLDGDVRIDAGTDTGVQELMTGDYLLLCTDGLTSAVPDHRLASTLQEGREPSDCAAWLVERAIAAGSDDNITVMILRVDRSLNEPAELTLW
ncbi:MAG: serine/threonine protein phosphatase PrpC [Myxococcota bacterium]|jgi:serine/threonine protein phosphatase PrpC